MEEKKMEEESKVFDIVKLILASVLLGVSFIWGDGVVSLVLRICSAVTVGYELLINSVKSLGEKDFFNENTLMIIGSVVAFVLGESFEGAIIVILYSLGELLEDVATDKSKDNIAGLAKLKAVTVNVFSDANVCAKDPESVEIGSIIVVKKGEMIPIDSVLESDFAELDLKAITGESKTCSLRQGENAYSGSVNVGDVIRLKTVKAYKDSTVERIIKSVEDSAEKKAKSQKFISAFARVWTPSVLLLALLIAFIPPVFSGDLAGWIHKSLSFLIVSCPCAVVISVPLAFFIGIGSLAKNGVLVKGSDHVDTLAKVTVAVFDKTGTLTTGNYAVKDVIPERGYEKDYIGNIACALEKNSDHPIAKAVSSAFTDNGFTVSDFKETAGCGVSGVINGKVYSVKKPDKKYLIGKKQVTENDTAIAVYENGVPIGIIVLKDEYKTESRLLKGALKSAGVKKTVIISGDKESIVKETQAALGFDESYYELMPQQKTEILSSIIKDNQGKTLYCGDGINDSPSIAMADVGVAMGALGSDIAIESADVVISDDNPLKIPLSINKAKRIRRTVFFNVVFSVAVKIAIMILGVTLNIPLWISALGDVGVMIIAVFNSILLSFKK